jgi:phospholipase/carboxylesterase
MDERYLIISARAPYDLPPMGAAWYAINFDAEGGKFSDTTQAAQSIKKIRQFIKQLQQHYSIDSENLNLLGFSQGAILSYALSLNAPSKFNAVVAMSGYLNHDLLEKGDAGEFRFHESETTTTYFVSHGTMDQVVPFAWARQAPPELQKIGVQHVWKEYPMGHGVSPQNFYDMREWLDAQVFN